MCEGDWQSAPTSLLVCSHDLESPGTLHPIEGKSWTIPLTRIERLHIVCVSDLNHPGHLSVDLSQIGQGPDEGSGFMSLLDLDGTEAHVDLNHLSPSY